VTNEHKVDIAIQKKVDRANNDAALKTMVAFVKEVADS
jgi:hypothetical protein